MEIFKLREENRMFEPNSTVLEKTVHVRLDGRNLRYSDFISVVDAVQKSGASAIVLVLDEDLPFLEKRPKYVIHL
jgi:biopolymer transport protein ExbD